MRGWGLGSGNDAVTSWPQGPRATTTGLWKEPRDLGGREPPGLGVLSPSPCLHPRREGFNIGGYWALSPRALPRNPAFASGSV